MRSLNLYRDFSGGLSEAAPDNMMNNELILAQNAVPDNRGGLAKCKGAVRVNETEFDGEPVSLLVALNDEDDNLIPLVFSGTTLRKWDGTVIKDDLPGPPKDYIVYKDKLWWLDGQKFWQYDGTNVSEVTMNTGGDATVWDTIKTCDFVEQRGQRFFYAKKGTNLIYFSEIGDPAHIKGTSEIQAITNDEDTITGLKEFSDALLVFKRNAIFAMRGWDFAEGSDIRFDRLMVSKGTVSQNTIQRVENALVYMADDDVYALTSPYPSLLASVKISDQKISKVIRNAINKEKATAIYYNGAYRLSLCTEGTENNVEYRYYPNLKAWYGPFTLPAKCYYIRQSDNKLFGGSANTGLIYELGTGYNFDGQPIPFKVITKPFDLVGRMVQDAKIKKAYIAVRQYGPESSTLRVNLKTDYVDTAFNLKLDESFVWGEALWGEAIWGWIDTVTKEMKIGEKGKRVQVTIENNEIDQPVTIYGLGFMFKAKKPKASKLGVAKEANPYATD
jgi:hypothetical protein